jgi:hypothetical protein
MIVELEPLSLIGGMRFVDDLLTIRLVPFGIRLVVTKYRPEHSGMRTRLYCANAVTHVTHDLSNEPTVY